VKTAQFGQPVKPKNTFWQVKAFHVGIITASILPKGLLSLSIEGLRGILLWLVSSAELVWILKIYFLRQF
jgi:hypothetical protein